MSNDGRPGYTIAHLGPALRRSTLPAEPARAGDLGDQRDEAPRGRLRATSPSSGSRRSTGSRASTSTGSRRPSVVVIPGNHDSRNVGYVHFEELFGERNSVLKVEDCTVVAIDSERARPRSTGTSGAGATAGSRSSSSRAGPDCVFALPPSAAGAGHRLPSGTSSTTPATRSSASSARTSTSCLGSQARAVRVAARGHLRRASETVSTLRLRGKTRPCYNVIEVTGPHVDVWRKYPFHGQEKIIQFSTDTRAFEKYTARIEGEVTTRS